jgi:uncharacterized protein with PIN domain
MSREARHSGGPFRVPGGELVVPAPLSDRKRRAILADIEAGEKSRNQIARDHKVSVSSVTRLAPAGSFDRSKTEVATRAKVADTKARRADLAALLLDDAHRLRTRLWEASKQIASSPAGPEVITLDLPPARDAKDFMAAVSGAVKSHVDIEKLDTDTGANDAKSMLGALGQALQVAADNINGTESNG